MKIESIRLKNFKAFKEIEIKKIPKMCVFVGANGTIEGILSSNISHDLQIRYIVFEGKQDLEKQITRKLKGYHNQEAIFLILRDQDSGNCQEIKHKLKLKQKCQEAYEN